MLIIGQNESDNNTISVRRRFLGDLGSVNLDSFVEEIVNEISNREKGQTK